MTFFRCFEDELEETEKESYLEINSSDLQYVTLGHKYYIIQYVLASELFLQFINLSSHLLAAFLFLSTL